jgi:uncharacterized protein (TIGR00299 family) protein
LNRLAWFGCASSGVAGDMALGALLDAGAPLDGIRSTVAGLGVDGWTLAAEPVLRGGIAATRALVEVTPGIGDHHHRTWRTIRRLLADSTLPQRVRDRSLATFAALAEIEGRLHRVAPDDVHFHEVGALDAIVDVVGTCAALELLGVGEVRCSPVAQGSGTVLAAHGTLPVPAPAVAALLAAAGAPIVGVDVDVELCTPTGAALVTALAGPDGFGPVPAMRLRASGFGAGARELEGRPNVVQVLIGEAAGAVAAGPGAGPGEAAVVVEANVDDATGEVLAQAVVALLAAGAADAWVVPIVMKKGRPAHTVAALCDPAAAGAVAAALVAETGSLGVRATTAAKWPQPRAAGVVRVNGHPVRVKIAGARIKPEHDDALAVASTLGWPLRAVLARAEAGPVEPSTTGAQADDVPHDAPPPERSVRSEE